MALDLNRRLSPNFTLDELLQDDIAERDDDLKEMQRKLTSEILGNLEYLAATALQPIRDRFGIPIRIKSGYRCRELNQIVGGSSRSQHRSGEAADLAVTPAIKSGEAFADVRNEIETAVRERVGRPLRADVHPNFYLFAFICLHLEDLDVDQVVHEYGDGFGQPAWVHVSASRRMDKRQVLFRGSYTGRRVMVTSVDEALRKGCHGGKGILGRLRRS
jgi:hypothetical protein